MRRPRASIAALLMAAAVGSAAADTEQVPADELPERWQTGAVMGADRTGDLRAVAIAIEDAAARAAAEDRVLTLDDARALGAVETTIVAALEPPPSIRVWRRGVDGSTSSCSGRVDVIPLEKYVKGVLPAEWIRSWQPASLEAGAIAIRTYASYWVAAGGKYDCADLDDTTASQVYKDAFYPQSDAAVDATAGVLAVKDGALVFAEYSAENGDPTAMNVAEPLCTGRARMGHGRGTCQWGTQRWAQDGKTYAWIVAHYYPGATLRTPEAPPPPVDAGSDPGDDDASAGNPSAGAAGGCASGRGGLGLVFGLALAAAAGALVRRRAPLAVLAVLAVAAGGTSTTGCAPAGEPSPRASVLAVGGESELAAIFQQVAGESGVPASILAAAAYGETRLAMIVPDDDGHAHGPAAWGLFALTDGGVRDVARAAALGGVSIEAARTDALATTRAAAALLADLAGRPAPSTLAGWRPALAAFAGGGDVGLGAADQVLSSIARGVAGRDDAGRRLVISARPEALQGGGVGTTTLALGYPTAIWNPAYSGNFQAANRGAAQINYVIIHTAQGSYGGTINWFKNPAAEVSAHYVARSSDGQITQMVDDSDIAWHDACFNTETIGIEHEGFVDNPSWYTEAMYMQSAKLTAWLADQYAIPKDRAHIMGHGEAPDCSSHTDPGPNWNWAHYMDLVRGNGAPMLGASLAMSDYPRDLTSGDEGVAWVEYKNESNITWGLDATRLGTAEPMDRASPFFVDGNWISPNRPTGADHSNYGPGAVGRFTFAIKAPVVERTTTFHESFQLVQEGVGWFGPVVSLDITVHPVGGDPDDPPDPEPEPADPSGDQSGGCAAGGGGAGAGAGLVLAGLIAIRRRRR